MSLTQIDVDDEALTEVIRLTGARTKREAINTALRQYVAREGRIAAMSRAVHQAKSWDHAAFVEQRDSAKYVAE